MKEGWGTTYRFLFFSLFSFFSLFLFCCKQPDTKKEKKPPAKGYIKPIAGKSEPIPPEESAKGQVLIAYSDCYTCHTVDKRSKGPAFKDIAKRYPANDGYINLLARKIIVGGSGAWGYPVMAPHPDISVENATLMVKYILSLKE